MLRPNFYKLQTSRAKIRCFSNEKVLTITRYRVNMLHLNQEKGKNFSRLKVRESY